MDIYSLGVLLYMLVQGGQIQLRKDRRTGKTTENRFPPMSHTELRHEMDIPSLLDPRASAGGPTTMQFPTDRSKYREMKEKAARWNKHSGCLELIRTMTNDAPLCRGTCETVRGHKVGYDVFLHNVVEKDIAVYTTEIMLDDVDAHVRDEKVVIGVAYDVVENMWRSRCACYFSCCVGLLEPCPIRIISLPSISGTLTSMRRC